MRVLYATDFHLRARNPVNRIDNYAEEILSVFREISQVIKQKNIDCVLFGGDIFDTPRISQELYNELASILSTYKVIPYVVPGNHDIFGQTINTLDQTMLQGLHSSGLIQIITRESGTILLSNNEITIGLAAQEYYSGIDKDNKSSDYDMETNPFTDYHILLTHGMLLDKPFHPDVHHTLIEEVSSNADIIFGAHYHSGWAKAYNGRTWFCHPGAVARIEATKAEKERKVSYIYIDFTKAKFSIDIIPFESPKDGYEIFAEQEEKEQPPQLIETFVEKIDEQLNHLNAYDILMSDTTLLPDHLKELIHQYTTKAEQAIDNLNEDLSSFDTLTSTFFIDSIEIKNFQSHKNTIINFTDGLNAIIGASDVGKTAIIRALRWVLYNEPKGSDFITHQESEAVVKLNLNTGYSIERKRTKSSSGYYRIYKDNVLVNEFTGFGHQSLSDIINAHQMPKIHLTKDIDVSLNISQQLDGPFLLDESVYTKAYIIGHLTGAHLIDESIRMVSKDILSNQKESKLIAKQQEKLKERIDNDFDDIPIMESFTEVIDSNIESFYLLESNLNLYESIYNLYNAQSILLFELSQKELAYCDLQSIDESISDLYNLLDRIKNLELVYRELVSLQNNLQKYNAMDWSILSLNINFESQLADLKEKELYHEEYDDLLSEVKSLDKQYELNQNSINAIRERYKDLLAMHKSCPLCKQNLPESLVI